MLKNKILSLIMVGVIGTSLMGCTKNEEKTKREVPEVASITYEDKYQTLQGTWAENLLLTDVENAYADRLQKMEDQTRIYGLEYIKEDKVKETEEGIRIGENFIYLDNEQAEKNRLESFYFGMKTYGATKEAGQIQLKVSLNFDGEGALTDNIFDFAESSLAKYSSIFTGIENRDYSELNAKIIEVLKSESGEGIIENSIDGLYEELTVSKDVIIYRLETKKYDFKRAEAEDPTNLEKNSQ